MLNTAIDSKRQTIDMLHPMYDIKVSALASVGYGKNAHSYVSELIGKQFGYLFGFMFSRH